MTLSWLVVLGCVQDVISFKCAYVVIFRLQIFCPLHVIYVVDMSGAKPRAITQSAVS